MELARTPGSQWPSGSGFEHFVLPSGVANGGAPGLFVLLGHLLRQRLDVEEQDEQIFAGA